MVVSSEMIWFSIDLPLKYLTVISEKLDLVYVVLWVLEFYNFN